MKALTVGECFAGIGGFALAATRVWGPGCVRWQIEVDAYCSRVLAKHWPDVRRFADIREVRAEDLEPVDVLVGGWPCQGNSVAGKRAGHADPRSGLFSELLRLADALHPCWLVFENVPGLVSVNGGADFAAVIHELRRRGYVGCIRLLDAQHFGLAQRRKRLFFVCGLGAAGRRAVHAFLEGGERYPAPRRKAGEGPSAAIGGGSESGGGVSGTLNASAAGTGRPAGQANEPDLLVSPPLVIQNDAYRRNGIGARKSPALGISERGAPCYTLDATAPHAIAFIERTRADGRTFEAQEELAYALTNPGSGGRTDSRQLHDGRRIRRLTPTECERLQGFPDGHTCLCGLNGGRSVGAEPCRCSDGPRYRALGNAVAVPPVAWVLAHIAEAEGAPA